MSKSSTSGLTNDEDSFMSDGDHLSESYSTYSESIPNYTISSPMKLSHEYEYDTDTSVEDEVNLSKSSDDINIAATENKAIRFSRHGEKENALKEFIRCVVLSKIAFGEKDWIVGKFHIILATAYLDLKGYAEQAIYHCNIAEGIISHLEAFKRKSKESSGVLNILMQKEHTYARAQMSLNKLHEAETFLTKARQLFESWSKCAEPDDIKSWELNIAMTHGRLYMLMKKWELSMKYFEKALEMEIDKNGKNHSNLIPIYQNLGKIEQSGQPANHDKAIEHYLMAHSIATSNFGSKSLKVADTSFVTALAFANIHEPGAESSAESYLKESLGIYKSLSGNDHLKSLEVLDELARLYIRTERILDGIKLLESSMPIREEQYNYYSKEIAAAFKLIASSYMSIGDMTKAWKNFEKCITIEQAVFGGLHKLVESTKKTMDMLLQNPALSSKVKK